MWRFRVVGWDRWLRWRLVVRTRVPGDAAELLAWMRQFGRVTDA